MYHILQYVSVRAVHRHIDKMYQYVCILQDVYYKLCMLVVIEYMYICIYIYIHIIYIYIYCRVLYVRIYYSGWEDLCNSLHALANSVFR